MSGLSLDAQRLKRSSGTDAQDLEDSVSRVADDFKRVLVSFFLYHFACSRRRKSFRATI